MPPILLHGIGFKATDSPTVSSHIGVFQRPLDGSPAHPEHSAAGQILACSRTYFSVVCEKKNKKGWSANQDILPFLFYFKCFPALRCKWKSILLIVSKTERKQWVLVKELVEPLQTSEYSANFTFIAKLRQMFVLLHSKYIFYLSSNPILMDIIPGNFTVLEYWIWKSSSDLSTVNLPVLLIFSLLGNFSTLLFFWMLCSELRVSGFHRK